MRRAITGIDHPVIAVRDLQVAHDVYRRLGFTVPPRGSHLKWGTGNWCIMFAENYLELRGVITPSSHTRKLEDFVAHRGEGLMGVALGTDDTEASAEALRQAGFHPQPVHTLARDFEVPEGTLHPRFSLSFLDETETAGLMSVVLCQHLTPELIRRPEWLVHGNGVTGLRSLTGIVDDVALTAAVQSRLWGSDAVDCEDHCVSINCGLGQTVDLATPGLAAARFPE